MDNIYCYDELEYLECKYISVYFIDSEWGMSEIIVQWTKNSCFLFFPGTFNSISVHSSYKIGIIWPLICFTSKHHQAYMYILIYISYKHVQVYTKKLVRFLKDEIISYFLTRTIYCFLLYARPHTNQILSARTDTGRLVVKIVINHTGRPTVKNRINHTGRPTVKIVINHIGLPTVKSQ
jgi:hypothetical protein